jgi:hypothetical protein
VFAWTFPATELAHFVLVADLQNPTERKCLVAAREVLARYGHLSLPDAMLDVWGSAGLSQGRVLSLLTSCAEASDVASTFVRTPFFGASEISDHLRPLAIDASRELIDSGYHREAVMWIVVIHIFPDDGRSRPLDLVSATTAGTGVLICCYQPARR